MLCVIRLKPGIIILLHKKWIISKSDHVNVKCFFEHDASYFISEVNFSFSIEGPGDLSSYSETESFLHEILLFTEEFFN